MANSHFIWTHKQHSKTGWHLISADLQMIVSFAAKTSIINRQSSPVVKKHVNYFILLQSWLNSTQHRCKLFQR